MTLPDQDEPEPGTWDAEAPKGCVICGAPTYAIVSGQPYCEKCVEDL